MRVVPASDRALLVAFDDAITEAAGREVRVLHAWLVADPIRGVVDLHPAYASILVRFDPSSVAPETLASELTTRARSLAGRPTPQPRSVSLPVRYGGESGPDLADVARATGLAEREVIERHERASYEVSFLGFSPGFPYLTGLPAELAVPRRPTPRRSVPAGSVAIAGSQAGIYPLATPGGWNLIGATSAVLFDPRRSPACLLAPGDRVRFVPTAGSA